MNENPDEKKKSISKKHWNAAYQKSPFSNLGQYG